jgi:hypothetical protein
MPAAGVVLLITVVAIVLVLVYYLVSTIFALRQITAGLDVAIGSVVEIIEKSAPVEEIVTAINRDLDAGVDLLEGLLVKKAGMRDVTRGSLMARALYPEARQTRPERLERSPIIGTDAPVQYQPQGANGDDEPNDTEGEPGADARSV